MQIFNTSKNSIVSENCKIADTFIKRFFGLMGKKSISPNDGLLIEPCNSIHMFFMKISIDVIFLSNENKVLHLIKNFKPWRISKIISKSKKVLELPVGIIDSSNTQVGDILEFNIKKK